MPSQIAGLVYTIGILGLFFLEWRQKERTSAGLWIAIIYIFLIASRPVSMWLNLTTQASIDQAMEGSPIDRVVFAALQTAACVVLWQRSAKVSRILQQNLPILVYLGYCLASAVWSDYPGILLKRWIKLVGDLMMMLLVVTDPKPLASLKRFLVRPAFLLIPLSVLFIKYYPQLGRGYDAWTGAQFFNGVSYNKNMLGVICLIWGVGFVWLLVDSYQGRRRLLRWPMPMILGILAFDLWLLRMSSSATSLSCLLAGAALIFWSRRRVIARRPILIHIPVLIIILGSFSALFLNIGSSQALSVLERDSTLTGRTELWTNIFKMVGNPLLGAGYESFWLGNRLEALWKIFWWRPTQAHNGYIEIYINLGWLGISLFTVMLVSGYMKAIASVRRMELMGSLRLAYIVIAIPYNFTEAGFRMQNLPWIFLLLAIIGIPQARESLSAQTTPRAPVKLSQVEEDQWFSSTPTPLPAPEVRQL